MVINIQLVTTDNLRKLIRKKLLENNYSVVSETSSYHEGFVHYRTFLPDITLIDLDITNTSEAIRLCRQIYGIDPDAQVIIISEYLSPNIKSELFEIGIEFWLEKPFEHTRILQFIDKINSKNNLSLLRENRKKILLNNSSNNKDNETTQKDRINSDIRTLRAQIKQNRQSQNETIKDTSSEIFTSSDFSLEESFELNFEHLNQDLVEDNNSIDLYKSNYYDDSMEHERSNIKSKSNQDNTGYLGLPIFNHNESIHEYSNFSNNEEDNLNTDNNPGSTKKESLLGFFKKLKK